ncbi:copper chaperone PCu(A)C [Achromobacter ruhlandii]|uniref:Copper chaperone PCu(A)C n=1 Tax=Achromobacter ruhlandii TaxID=72557 RepID=A0A848NIR6_9BURK|nr:copper chaperone PCu(A)C [Achromobacter ruhlandii]NMU90453.1 copper chaperone PCu(A)C [Achromobacter ruhlandii]
MKTTRFKSLAAAFALGALALAGAPAVAQDASLKVEDAWVRATVPSQHATGVFMRLTSPTAARLVGVESDAARHVEVHEMAMQDNVMKMRQVSAIDLPAGKPVELKPGGYHVMLIDLARQISAGDPVALTLLVQDADGKQRRVPVTAEARPLSATAAPAGEHKH